MADDFIRREAAINAVFLAKSDADITLVPGSFTNGFREGAKIKEDAILNALADVPAADVRPVLHAHWERVSPDDNYDFRCVCSHCHQYLIDSDEKYDFKYCPNCGAGMDEEVDDG